ncbi:MAG: type 4a pilus biogenesis protein PilO [Pseudomonadota bacterium]
MSKLISSFLAYVHFLILAWGGYQIYDLINVQEQQKEALTVTIEGQKGSLASKKKEVAKLKDYFADVQTAKENIEKVAQELVNLQKRLPNDNSDTSTLEVIQYMASTTNLVDVFISPEPQEQNMGFYLIKTLNFKATGTFLQFLFLLESIGNHERIFNIPFLKLIRSEKNQKGRFQLASMEMKINSYRYNPEHKEDLGIKAIEDKFKNKPPEKPAAGAPPARAAPAKAPPPKASKFEE